MSQKYLYVGPLSSVTLATGVEIPLVPQKEIEVDATLPYFKRLIAKGHLKKVVAPKAAPPQETPTEVQEPTDKKGRK